MSKLTYIIGALSGVLKIQRIFPSDLKVQSQNRILLELNINRQSCLPMTCSPMTYSKLLNLRLLIVYFWILCQHKNRAGYLSGTQSEGRQPVYCKNKNITNEAYSLVNISESDAVLCLVVLKGLLLASPYYNNKFVHKQTLQWK